MDNTERPKEARLLREWVKYQLRLQGITFTALAKSHGGRKDMPCRAFTLDTLPKWERVVAAAMNMKPEELWPARYAARKAKKACGKSTRKRRATQ